MNPKVDAILTILDDLESDISKLVYSNRNLQPKHIRKLDKIETQLSLLKSIIIKEVINESDTRI